MADEIPKDIRQYFDILTKKVNECYRIAEKARKKGKDPSDLVEIPPAEDMASRVEQLIGPPGVRKRILELIQQGYDIDKLAFKIAEEIVKGVFFKELDREELVKLAIRAGLSIVTAGITAAPLDGLPDIRIKKNPDGTEYLAMFFSGPIRAAGGTATAQAVMLGDYVRNLLNLDKYKPNEQEVERYLEEISIYKRVRNLQFPVKGNLIRIAAANIPIEITGEPTEKEEVTGYRNLPRINTNKLRGGACLVFNDGIIGKANKLMKIVDTYKFKGWEWLKDLEDKDKDAEDEENGEKIKPKDKFISGVIAGRPILAHPSRMEGFRVRYGRTRNTGLAAVGLNPFTMKITESFLVQGTQFITERPGKGSISIAVDSIEGPIVKLYDGSVVKIENEKDYKAYKDKVKRILYLGDVLIGFGEFVENNHILIPSGYTEEWWSEELKKLIELKFGNEIKKLVDASSIGETRLRSFINDPFGTIPEENEALKLSKLLDIAIHPKYTFFWEYITDEDVKKIRSWFLTAKLIDNFTDKDNIKNNRKFFFELELKSHEDDKKILEKLGVEHYIDNEKILIKNNTLIFSELLDLNHPNNDFSFILPKKEQIFVGELNSYKIRAKAPYRIGARMGRPEKANERVLFHTLFPVGSDGGNRRDIIKAAGKKQNDVEIVNRKCPKCEQESLFPICSKCKIMTIIIKKCINPDCGNEVSSDFCPYCKSPVKTFSKKRVSIAKLLSEAQKNIQERAPKYIKGVKSLMNKDRVPEPLEKAILRGKWDVSTFRDGTIRFDAVDAALTHFKPSEIGISVDQVKQLGYKNDYLGDPIVSPDQVVELRAQDIIIPYNAAEFFIKVGGFIDDLLVKFYGLQPYYNLDTITDLIGQIVIGMAPHTSAGIVGRIIGFTKSRICYAHPYWHAAKRRNCDGDEDSIILLLDALLNFSRFYLPATRGGLMDAPLVISIILHPEEVDKEAYNLEIIRKFPLEFYEETLKYAHPNKLLNQIEIIKHRLGKPNQYTNLDFSVPNTNIDMTPTVSAYKQFKSTKEKVDAQLTLGCKIDAVDITDEAKKLLDTHFIPDIRGNMRAFGTQQVRCPRCNIKYRRIPLIGKCSQCQGNLIFTVNEGGIVKYLELAKEIANKYNLSNYIKERLELTENDIDTLFKHRKKVVKLAKFL